MTSSPEKSNIPWDGNATGSLDLNNEAADLFRDFKVTNNPYVNEASTKIIRNPEVNTTLYRTSFGDDPVNHKWLNWTPASEPITKSGSLSYGGTVRRPYEYQVESDDKSNTRHGTATANFESGQDLRMIKVRVYNGTLTITPKIFQNKIDNNTIGILQKNLYWTSEPYLFNVIRWMHHIDENNAPYAYTAVDGQYQRTFTQQCTAVNTAKAASSMVKDYYQSREAAEARRVINDLFSFLPDV